MQALLESLICWSLHDFLTLAGPCCAFLCEAPLAIGEGTSHVVGTRAGRASDTYVAAVFTFGFATRRAYRWWMGE